MNYHSISSLLSDPEFILKWTKRHLFIQAVLCFLSIYLIAVLPATAAWFFLSTLGSILGVSINVCCCSTQLGWKINLSLQYISLALVSIILFASSSLLSSSKGAVQKRSAIILFLASLVSLFCLIPFIYMCRCMIRSFGAVVPVSSQEYQLSYLPQSATASYVNSNSSNVIVASPVNSSSGGHIPIAFALPSSEVNQIHPIGLPRIENPPPFSNTSHLGQDSGTFRGNGVVLSPESTSNAVSPYNFVQGTVVYHEDRLVTLAGRSV